MIRNISKLELTGLDYQVMAIDSYSEVNGCKVLVVDEENLDPLKIRELYVTNPKIRIILIADVDLVEYLELGIDYIVTDTFALEKVNAIIHNLDTRHKIISRVQIKEDFNKINVSGVDIRLTPKEMQIYAYLNANRGNLCKRTTMLTEVLGYHDGADSRVIDVYVKHLRTKLREEGFKIETIRGKGYIYNF
ncbi:winged helix-turn-helix domain-containing protein [Mollicutes bacterium LVI A0039]|nr:winged helix-turn-helix domain-containing protein [Mollicutes bacterium LVI A0039]